MKIQATPEGRTNIFIPDADSLIAWIEAQRFKRIHNFIPQGGIMIGADHDVESVIEDIRAAERMAITIGPEWQNICATPYRSSRTTGWKFTILASLLRPTLFSINRSRNERS